jgi:recombination protein RecT
MLKQENPVARLKSVLDMPSVQAQFKNAMGKNAGMFTASIIDVYATDKTLQKCEPNTVVMEALKAATLNLPINRNLGFAYIIPFKGKATMQIGYKGYIQLAMRTGQYRNINADAVLNGELKEYDKLTGEIDLSGSPESEEVIGYFAHIETVYGFRKTVYWTKEKVIAHAKRYSQSFGSDYSPWKTDFNEMAKKTVLKYLLSKYGVMSVDLVQALQKDSEFEAEWEEGQYANQGSVIDIDPSKELPEKPKEPQEQPEKETKFEPGF